MTVPEMLRSLPPIEGAILRMLYGLVPERPYEHTLTEIAERLEISVARAAFLRDSALYALKRAASREKTSDCR